MLITYIMYYLVKSELKHKHVVKHNMYSVLVFFLRFKMTSFQLCVHFFIYDLQMHKTENIYGSSCSQCTHTITTVHTAILWAYSSVFVVYDKDVFSLIVDYFVIYLSN